jgi:hypothetical protein
MTGLRASSHEVTMRKSWNSSRKGRNTSDGQRQTKIYRSKKHQEGGRGCTKEADDITSAESHPDSARKAGHQGGETRQRLSAFGNRERRGHKPMEAQVTYEIVKKSTDNSTTVVEAVKGLEMAEKRMNQLNAEGPDEYFIFDPEKASVVEPSAPGVAIDPFAP